MICDKFVFIFQELLPKIKQQQLLVSDFELTSELESRVKNIISKMEPVDIADQMELYKKWNDTRQEKFNEEVEASRIEQRKREIADMLLELQAKEEKLNFFEQREKISLGISRMPPEETAEAEEEEIFVAAPGTKAKK